jgi:phosphinothricin acetyltransferase
MTIEFRIADTNDADGILAIYAPYCESSTVTFETVAPTREQMTERISRIITTYPWLVATANGDVIGYVYASRFRERAAYVWTAEVAVYVDTKRHKRGLGRALYTSLFSILRAQGFAKAIAGITMPNPASIALHEKMGFLQTGNFPGVGYKDAWLDVGWWQFTLRPETDDPPEPVSFATIRDSQAVADALREGSQLANK